MYTYTNKIKNCVDTYSIYFIYFRVTDVMVKRIFKFWLWNQSIFNLSQNGKDFNKSLKVLHTFTENVSKNLKHIILFIKLNNNY